MRSAIITTYQSSKTIAYALESIKDFVDSVCIVDGRWSKDADGISTALSPFYYQQKQIVNEKSYLKLIENIENVIPSFSTDETIRICDSYKHLFKNFHIIVNKERRVRETDARTQGLKHILSLSQKSDWIYLVDSDEIWTTDLKKEIAEIENDLSDDRPYNIQMNAKVFINLKQFYYSDYMRGFKNCSMICDFFSAANTIPYYKQLPKIRENSAGIPADCLHRTKSYFLHYSIPSPTYHFLKSLCYGAYGLQAFLKNTESNNSSPYYMEYFGSDRKIEDEESSELIELGFK